VKVSLPDTLFGAADTIIFVPQSAESASTDDLLPDEVSKTENRTSVLSFLKYNPQQTFIFTTPAFWIFFLVVMAGFALLRKKRAAARQSLFLLPGRRPFSHSSSDYHRAYLVHSPDDRKGREEAIKEVLAGNEHSTDAGFSFIF
jgi:hypothetical protein